MNLDKLTVKAQEALGDAQSLMHSHNHSALDTEHLLLALLRQKDGVVPPLLDSLGVPAAQLDQQAQQLLSEKPRAYGESSQAQLSGQVSRILARAQTEAGKLKDEYVSTEHLLLAMTEEEGDVAAVCSGSPG